MTTDTAKPKSLVTNLSRTAIRNREEVFFHLDIPQVGRIDWKKILRGVSGKRLLCYGCNKEQEFVAKLFFHPVRAKKHWQQSYQGHLLFVSRDIPTPPIRYAGYLEKDELFAIVFDFIPSSISRGPVHTLPGGSEQSFEKIVSCLTDHHQKGLIQYDVNPGNFLFQNGRALSLDGDHVQCYARPIGKRRSLENLGLLFSNCAIHSRPEIRKYYRHYAALRQWPVTDADLDFVLRKVRRAQSRKRRRAFFRKGRWKRLLRL